MSFESSHNVQMMFICKVKRCRAYIIHIHYSGPATSKMTRHHGSQEREMIPSRHLIRVPLRRAL